MPATRSELARQIARTLGSRAFRGHWDLRNILDDCESSAFELELTAPPHAKASSIAWFAVKRVRVGRQHKQSVRSIDSARFEKRCKKSKNVRHIHIDLRDMASPEQPPSETVPGWMDYQTWLAAHDARKRAIAEALAVGGRTGEVAHEFKVSPGRIAQLRVEFSKSWKEFQHSN